MGNFERLSHQPTPELTAEGEVYNELEQDRELDELSDDLEKRARKAEVSSQITGEYDKNNHEAKLNAWEKMAAKLPGFNRERAERARTEREKEIREKERFEAARKVIESGDIEGFEDDLNSWFENENINEDEAREQISGYRRFLRAKEINEDPEKLWRIGYVANNEMKTAELRAIEAVKKMSKNAKSSMEQLANYRTEQERRANAEKNIKKENNRSKGYQYEYSLANVRNVENGRMRSPEPAKERHIDATQNSQAESEAPKSTEKETEKYQGYTETTDLPDQGPDLIDPLSMMSA